MGHYADALVALEQALQRIPDDAQAWASKGYCLYHLGRFDDGIAAYEEAVRLNPDDADVRKSYAQVASNIRRTTVDQRMQLRDGRWLGYLDYGDPDGAPIFWFHGAPGSRLEFSGYDELLKELHIRLIAPDRPGYGLSDFQPHRRLLDWPADVEQLADHLGIERFAVAGVSAGGPHAAACAYAIPQRLTRVGLISGATPRGLTPLSAYLPLERISNFRGRYLPWLLFHATSRWSLWSVRDDPSRWAHSTSVRVSSQVGESLRSLLSQLAASNPPPLPPAARERVLEPFHQGASGYAWDGWICAHSWGFRPGNIHGVEVYLWHGEQDTIVPVSAARALAAAIPGCHATFYPDESHNLNAHIREILTAIISGAESEQSEHETGESL
jgi:pimeloyl-ACP methyl ester carboxylesterase